MQSRLSSIAVSLGGPDLSSPSLGVSSQVIPSCVKWTKPIIPPAIEQYLYMASYSNISYVDASRAQQVPGMNGAQWVN